METIESKVGFWKNVKKSAVMALVGLSLGGGFVNIVEREYYRWTGHKVLAMDEAEFARLNTAVRFYEAVEKDIYRINEAVQFYEAAKNQYLKEKAKEILYEMDKNKGGNITREEAGLPPRQR